MNNPLLIISGCLLAILLSCGSDPEDQTGIVNDTVVGNDDSAIETSALTGCYRMTKDKDTGSLNLSVTGNKVSGKLEYKLFEKDSNKGIISGIVRDSLIIADYTFQSEGINSVREVVFLIKGNSLLEGYGEIRIVGDTSRFVGSGRLKFMPAPFVKVACEK